MDVLKQLGDKLQTQLQLQEQQLESLPRTEAAKKRATHIKLQRDFSRISQQCKTLQLETRRKRARLHEAQMQNEQRQSSLNENGDDELYQQLQQEDVRVLSYISCRRVFA